MAMSCHVVDYYSLDKGCHALEVKKRPHRVPIRPGIGEKPDTEKDIILHGRKGSFPLRAPRLFLLGSPLHCRGENGRPRRTRNLPMPNGGG
jgi:hypothetical protein